MREREQLPEQAIDRPPLDSPFADPTKLPKYLRDQRETTLIKKLTNNFFLKLRSFGILKPKPGRKIVDVGGGLGENARRIAAEIGESGSVTVVDDNEYVVADGIEETTEAGVNNVSFVKASAERLPFGDGEFEDYLASRLHQLLPIGGPFERAMNEALRVTRRRLVITDTLWLKPASKNEPPSTLRVSRGGVIYKPTLIISGQDNEGRDIPQRTTDEMVWYFTGRISPNPSAILRVRDFLRSNASIGRVTDTVETVPTKELKGLPPIHIIAGDAIRRGKIPEERLTQQQIDAWVKAVEEAESNGSFLASFTVLTVSATKKAN